MKREEKEQILARLRARYTNDSSQFGLGHFMSAGADRLGLHTDRSGIRGYSACDLAPALARAIDHTALKPDTTEADVETLCQEAREYCFASVCVNPCYVRLAARLLSGSGVAVCTVLGFPLGASASSVKAAEATEAVNDGATEVDMVMNLGMLKSGRHEFVENDIRGVVEAARAASSSLPGAQRVLVKVILETALLTDEEKVVASVLAKNAGADFVKTSTGFSKGGATAADVALMRRAVGPRMGVKASGGVRSREDAENMMAHGATRIGASASVAIMQGEEGKGNY